MIPSQFSSCMKSAALKLGSGGSSFARLSPDSKHNTDIYNRRGRFHHSRIAPMLVAHVWAIGGSARIPVPSRTLLISFTAARTSGTRLRLRRVLCEAAVLAMAEFRRCGFTENPPGPQREGQSPLRHTRCSTENRDAAILAVRKQVAVLKRKRPRPSLNGLDCFLDNSKAHMATMFGCFSVKRSVGRIASGGLSSVLALEIPTAS